jgi:hypothetical protein
VWYVISSSRSHAGGGGPKLLSLGTCMIPIIVICSNPAKVLYNVPRRCCQSADSFVASCQFLGTEGASRLLLFFSDALLD